MTNTASTASNPLFTGGLILMLTGSVLAILKDIPKLLYDALVHQTTATVKVMDESSTAFNGMAYWLQQQRFFRRVRHTDARKFKNDRNQDDAVFIPAPGTHWFLHEGWRPMWFKFERTETKAGGGFYGGSRYNENFTLGTLGRNKDLLKSIVQKAALDLKMRSNGASLKVYTDYYWKSLPGYHPRTLDSVILPTDVKDILVEDIEGFLKREPVYTASGTPYRRGYLFHGLPGTGKTSSIAGISSFFKKDVYLIQPQHMTDEQLSEALGDVPCHSVVVIEDVDCVTASRQKTEGKKPKAEEKKSHGVTLSGLLNCLDGLKVPHGVLFFLTTNHRERLDPALIRPGRVDFMLEFTWASKEQKEEYFQKFLQSAVPASIIKRKMTMAEVQQEAMKAR